MDLFSYMCGVVGFVLGGTYASWYIKRKFNISAKMPYRWECDQPGCVFEIGTSSDDPAILMTFIDTHKNHHEMKGG